MSITGNNCQEDACPAGATVVVALGEISQPTCQPSVEQAHGTSWTSACSTVDVGFSGDISCTCNKGVTETSTSNCVGAPCPASYVVDVNIADGSSAGASAQLSPSADMVHGNSETVACSTVKVGLTGNIDLQCFAGIVNAITSGCVAPACTSATVTFDDGNTGSLSSLSIASGGSLSTTCSSAHQGYLGTITGSCMLGTLTVDTSGCSPKPCQIGLTGTLTAAGFSGTFTLAHQMETGTNETAACSAGIDRLVGTMGVNCDANTLSFDKDGCSDGACTASTTPASVTVGGTAGTTVPSGVVNSGSTFNSDCASVNDGYYGSIVTSCLVGALAADASGCVLRPCMVGDTVAVFSANYALTSQIASGDSLTIACSAASSGWLGNMVLSCSAGVISANLANCQPVCLEGSTASVEIGGQSKTAAVSNILSDGGGEVTSCDTVSPGYLGDVTFSCSLGVLSATHTCTPKPCSTDLTTKVTVGGQTVTLSPPNELASGDSITWSCADAVADFEGEGTLSCSLGQVVADPSGCRGAPVPCPAGSTATASIAGSITVLELTTELKSGEDEQRDCTDLAAGITGTYKIKCNEGSVSTDTASCGGSPCLKRSIKVQVFLGGEVKTLEVPEGVGTEGADGRVRLQSGEGFENDCMEANKKYIGKIRSTCNFGTVTSDSSECAPGVCDADSEGSILTSLAGKEVSIAAPGLPLDTGEEYEFKCSELDAGYSGNAKTSCAFKVTAVDVSECGLNCLKGTTLSATVEGYSHIGELVLKDDLKNGEKFAVEESCTQIDEAYEGIVRVKCLAGTPSADTSQCKPGGCKPGLTSVVNIGGANEILTVPGLPLPDGGEKEIKCSELLEAYNGNALVSCTFGAATVDAFDCIRDCVPADKAEVRFNSITYKVSPTRRMEAGQFEERPCSALDPGYSGSIGLYCGTGGVLTGDVSECGQMGCDEGQVASVAIGSKVYDYIISEPLGPTGAATISCATFDPGFSGSVAISCSKGAVSADTSDCAPTGKGELEEVVVLKSAMSLALPTVEGASVDDMQAALDNPDVKGAFAKSIADGLGVPAEDCLITRLTVFQGRRLGLGAGLETRRLSAGMQVKVDFEVEGGGDVDVESKMSNLGVSSSPENQNFQSSLQQGLKEAAAKDEGGLLSSVASKVESEGVAVQAVEPPKKEIRKRIKEGTEPPPRQKEEGGDALVIFGIVLAICVVCGMIGVGVFALRHPERFGCKKDGAKGHIAQAYGSEKAKQVQASPASSPDSKKNVGKKASPASSPEKDPAAANAKHSDDKQVDPVPDPLSPSALELAVQFEDKNPTVQQNLIQDEMTDAECCRTDLCHPTSSSCDGPLQMSATHSNPSSPQVQHAFSEPDLDMAIASHITGQLGKSKSKSSIKS
eukprot:gnl/MRDRNA2_/MRDRNA2_152420_c0_seq1.p1 gnl/MRDRNA2_/MRDRNA2_152420_c0~~gnl/MRDRNA2_/MRDRNA2_152420_c0_seq1.p1  ORF type:complete len:1431 (+),score=266.54 gnl/MRDRNA2_/MRDRNA2_152420_c0_seq1:135-4295(+)